MTKFEPLTEKTIPPKGETSADVLRKAKEAVDVQKYETERIELQRKAVFAENDIKDTKDLKDKLKIVSEREAQLGKEKYDWDAKKAIEQSEIQKQKAELERKISELNKRAQDVAAREANVELREKLVGEREELMSSVERQKLEEAEEYNSLVEQVKRSFPRISALIIQNANILIQAGFHSLGGSLWDEIEIMDKWVKEGVEKYCDTMVEWMKGEVEDCNQKAVVMIRSPKEYEKSFYNGIVDNLEEIYELLPVLKPEYLPKD